MKIYIQNKESLIYEEILTTETIATPKLKNTISKLEAEGYLLVSILNTNLPYNDQSEISLLKLRCK